MARQLIAKPSTCSSAGVDSGSEDGVSVGRGGRGRLDLAGDILTGVGGDRTECPTSPLLTAGVEEGPEELNRGGRGTGTLF